jgi:hypothetical protein
MSLSLEFALESKAAMSLVLIGTIRSHAVVQRRTAMREQAVETFPSPKATPPPLCASLHGLLTHGRSPLPDGKSICGCEAAQPLCLLVVALKADTTKAERSHKGTQRG